jgi:8-oxo-dGTP diphosphatase
MLLLKRNVEPFKGYWHVVGGHVDENETLKEALTREFKEETDLDVKVGKILGSRVEETFDRIKLIVAFQIISAEGQIKINEENQEFGWFGKTPEKSVFDYFEFLKV